MDSKSNTDINNDSTVGLGVDIVSVAKMRDILDRTPSFVEHTFTEDEILYCNKSSRFVEHYATHFAAKEAVLKALGCGFSQGITAKDVEVCHNEKGKPYIKLHGQAKIISDKQKIKDLPISLSFTNNEAVGFAIALTDNSSKENQVLKKNNDPMVQLAKQFKEAKKILDEQN